MSRKVPETFKTHPRGACQGAYLDPPYGHVPVIPGIPDSAFPPWIRKALEDKQAAGTNSPP
jgi:hypothetical protein